MKTIGIRRQYLTAAAAILVIMVIVTLGTFLYVQTTWNDLTEERQSTVEKAQAMEELASSVNNLFFRVRGYYAFQIEAELEAAYDELTNVKVASAKLRAIPLNKQELQLLDELDIFLVGYEDVTLPYAVSLIEKNDYQGLRDLSMNGSNDTVNHFVSYAAVFSHDMSVKLKDSVEKTTTVLNTMLITIFITAIILLTFTAWLIWRVIRKLIVPIEQIKFAADEYQKGKEFNFQPIQRNDEIGQLSTSFGGMIKTILSKEEELTAQNEELLSQQEELYDKQVKMEQALSEARFSEMRLERYNTLNHHITFTLDEQELAEIVMDYFDKQYFIDIGIFWLPQNDISAFKGISPKKFEQFKDNQMDYITVRLEKEPYFVVKREATYEKGIAMSQTFVYDFISAIKDATGKITTFVALSRIGRAFTKEDSHDMYGLLQRIALSVDRIEQYEVINHERSLNQNILDNVNEGIRYVSANGDSDIFNNALLRILDFPTDLQTKELSREEMDTCFSRKVQDYGELQTFVHASLRSTEGIISHTFYTIQGESPKVIDVYSVPVLVEHEKVGTIFVHRDITKEFEVDRLKTELVSTVSHELRTPLSSVLGFTELLLSKEMDEKKQKRYLETIHKEALRLTNLINDFLDLQRMEAGQQSYQMSSVPLNVLAIETIEGFQLNNEHFIHIQNDLTTDDVYADYDKIIQVMTNLLSNSIKFSPNGGDIDILLKNNEQQAIVSITDHGMGIPAEQVDKLFEKFQRLDNSYSRNIGGTGLGLAICREIIEQHGGRIWIESKENVGTTVSFSLPLKLNMKSDAPLSNKPTVIIVEDDSSIALLLGEELKMGGFSVIHQSEVLPTFELAKVKQPDCIVVDLMLESGQSGWNLIKLLKEHKLTQYIPIVISSAIEREDELMQKFQVEHYMTKPYPLHELSETVLDVLHINDGRILYPAIDPDTSEN